MAICLSNIDNEIRFIDYFFFTNHMHPELINFHGNVNRKVFTLSTVTVTFNFLNYICASSYIEQGRGKEGNFTVGTAHFLIFSKRVIFLFCLLAK